MCAGSEDAPGLRRNACTKLYGLAVRWARADGRFSRVITFTREDELGTSVRAAGFQIDASHRYSAGGGFENRPGRATTDPIAKVRWFRETRR